MFQALFAARLGRNGADTGEGKVVEGGADVFGEFQKMADRRRAGDGDDVDFPSVKSFSRRSLFSTAPTVW